MTRWLNITTNMTQRQLNHAVSAMEGLSDEHVQPELNVSDQVAELRSFLDEQLPDADWMIEESPTGHVRVTLFFGRH